MKEARSILVVLAERLGAEAALQHAAIAAQGLPDAVIMRWSRFIGQFGGVAKLGSDCRHAASFIVPVALYASSGVRPASVECGRRVL